MREIKFRAWDLLNKSMCEVVELSWMKSGLRAYGPGYHIGNEWVTYDGPDDIKSSIVLMQFTGLLDSEGKEIFEGDIVNFNYFYGSVGANLGYQECEHQLTGVVKWGHSGWGLDAIKGEHWRGYTGFKDGQGYSSFVELYSMSESSYDECSFVVIGNIHENPELIDATQ